MAIPRKILPSLNWRSSLLSTAFFMLDVLAEINYVYIYLIIYMCVCVCVCVCMFVFRATPVAYRSFQARGQIETAAASLHHSNARSEPHLQPIPQLTAILDP